MMSLVYCVAKTAESQLPRKHKYQCRECGGDLFPVTGWITEPEGMRGNYFCSFCDIMREMHKGGFAKLGILVGVYDTDPICEIQNSLSSMIDELEKYKPFKNNRSGNV